MKIIKIIKHATNHDDICDSPLILNRDIKNESNVMNSILSLSCIKFFIIVNENYKIYEQSWYYL